MPINIPEHIRAKFLKNRRLGMNIDDSARCAGFNPKTFFDWKKHAEADPQQYPEEVAFMALYWKAKAKGVRHHMKNVKRHAKTDLRASIKWLAWNGYNEKQEIHLSGKVDVRQLTDDETLQELRQVLDARQLTDSKAEEG